MKTYKDVSEIVAEMNTNEEQTLLAATFKQPVLLVFLRHFGCTFCREALADLSKKRASIEASGTKLMFVHMSENNIAERYFQRYELEGVTHISDPERRFYQLFGLVKGNFNQLFGLQSWIRGFSAGVVKGHGIGSQLGDGFQMPGVFVLQNGHIQDQFIHKLSSDVPNYEELMRCCSLT